LHLAKENNKKNSPPNNQAINQATKKQPGKKQPCQEKLLERNPICNLAF